MNENTMLHMNSTYRGKPIHDMSREELVDALHTMSRLYQEALNKSLTT